ncbi:MAG: hypothetical protein JL50_09700 [Peptococcaceae bacterium BICA1-7]|nr:MAG: hypothetical protein JL50_09700 [Peptococcaceae bacterium BICA1-7]HBV95555.1 hypothetical protein [Desulfotomaculum sp.]
MEESNKKYTRKRKAEMNIRFSEFELPPMQDILVIGRRAPIGPEAVRRMVDALAPEQYELIEFEEGPVEAVAVKTSLFNWMARDILLDVLLEEALKINIEKTLLKVKLDLTISVFKEVDI